MKKQILLALPIMAGSCQIFAQHKNNHNRAATVVSRSDTTKKPTPASKTTIKPFDKVITSEAVSKKGLFTVHKVDDHYYFEIPDSLLGRKFLAVTRYTKTPGNAPKYGGELPTNRRSTGKKGRIKTSCCVYLYS